MDTFIKYNFLEVQKLRKELYTISLEVANKLETIKYKVKFLDRIISQNEKEKQEWVILLPANLVDNLLVLKKSEKTKTNKIKWKKLVFEILLKYDIPMTAEVMYHKAKQTYEDFPNDKQTVIKNLSSTLTYLYNERKILRHKAINMREYIYAFKEHFDTNGKIKQNSLLTFKIEKEGII